jgi:hypothetical protein
MLESYYIDVSGRPFHTIMFASKTGAHPSGAPLKVWLLAYLETLHKAGRAKSVTNTLAYLVH